VAGIDATEHFPTPATELSSRPERSAVEGPAVSAAAMRLYSSTERLNLDESG
jgi:hypothetical protein